MSTSEIKHKALQLGYLACRVIPANIFDEFSQRLDERVELFPESKELYKPLYSLARSQEGAQSVIVCTKRYNKYKTPDSLSGLIGKSYLFDARVDYSPEHRERAEFDAFLKTLGIGILKGQIPARMAASKAGLGKFGRNNFIYDANHGSYISVESWVIDMKLEYDSVEEAAYLDTCNDGCNRCINSCPTNAMPGSLSMDRGRCVNQLTTWARDIPDEDTMEQLGQWIYGCDVCQDVCPANKYKFTETEEFPLLAEFVEHLSPERLLEMDEDTYVNIINPRFWYAGEDGAWLWRCNALRSMINSGDEKYHGLIKQCCAHEDERVKKTAQWGCRVLGIV